MIGRSRSLSLTFAIVSRIYDRTEHEASERRQLIRCSYQFSAKEYLKLLSAEKLGSGSPSGDSVHLEWSRERSKQWQMKCFYCGGAWHF